MSKKYISLDYEGYITGWSDIAIDGWIEVEENEHYGRLGYVKYINGNFVIDQDKLAELSTEPVSEIEVLKQENQELKERIDMTEAALLEVTDMLLNHELGGESNV